MGIDYEMARKLERVQVLYWLKTRRIERDLKVMKPFKFGLKKPMKLNSVTQREPSTVFVYE